MSLLTHASTLTLPLRKAWDKIAKQEAGIAQCVGCEEGYRARIKDVVRSVIATGVAVAGVTKWIEDGAQPEGLEAEVPLEGVYHAWWVVPKLKKRGSRS